MDVRLRKVEFADEIRDSVFRRMESERKAIASERRSEGAAEAEKTELTLTDRGSDFLRKLISRLKI